LTFSRNQYNPILDMFGGLAGEYAETKPVWIFEILWFVG